MRESDDGGPDGGPRAPRATALLSDLAHRGARIWPGRPAFSARGTTRTFADVDDRVRRFTNLLDGAGLGPGSRIATLSGNDPEVLETAMAAARLGAVVVPINVRLAPDEVRFQLDDAGVTHAVVMPELEALAQASGMLSRTAWVIGDDLDGALAGVDGSPPDVERPHDGVPVIQLYTSGTTGRPKGCLLGQRGWLASNANLAHGLDVRSDDALLAGMPLFHVAGFGLALTHFTMGAHCVMPAGMDAGVVWDAVARHRVTTIPSIGLQALCEHPRREASDPSCVRKVLGGAGMERVHAFDALEEALPHVRWCGIYGSTEAGNVVSMSCAEEEREYPGTVGRALFGFDVAARDDGEEVPTGEVGELCLRGPSTMLGYWNLPEETALTLRDGWLHTGDLVRIDRDGYLYFVDRSKDMIKPGGENVYSVEVEAVLRRHPAVADVAVVGVPDARWGEAVKAVVVAAPGCTVTPAELDEVCLAQMGAFKRPRWYEFVEVIPRSPLGKVLKRDLRQAHDPQRAVRLPERR